MKPTIQQLPKPIRRVLEKHGIESDDLTFEGNDLIVAFDDLDEAFAVRETILDLTACCLISKQGKPALMIHHITTP